jgi:hypothetical protein
MAERRERGVVSVEFALMTPVLLGLILGGVSLGLALSTRHRLAEATAYAMRQAQVARIADSRGNLSVTIDGYVRGRFADVGKQCSALKVSAAVVPALAGARRLEVRSICTWTPAFGASLVELVVGDITVNAALLL